MGPSTLLTPPPKNETPSPRSLEAEKRQSEETMPNKHGVKKKNGGNADGQLLLRSIPLIAFLALALFALFGNDSSTPEQRTRMLFAGAGLFVVAVFSLFYKLR